MIPQRTITATCEISTGTLVLDNQVPTFTGESLATAISVALKNGGSAYSPSGAMAEMYLYWPGTADMTETVEMDISGSTLTGTMSDVMTARSGCPLLVIQLTDEESGDLIVAASAPIQIINVRGTVVISGRAPSPSEIVYIGRSPYIGANRHWYQWDVTTRTYVDTGIYARGETPYIRISDEHWMIWDSTTEAYVDSGYRATSKSPYIDDTTHHWFVWSDTGEQYVDTDVYAEPKSPYLNQLFHWMVWDPTTEAYIDSNVVGRGRSPYVDSTSHHWMVWSDSTSAYTDTGIYAEGKAPYVNTTTNTWMVWDPTTEAYVDSGVYAVGTGVASVNGKAPTPGTGAVTIDGDDIESGQIESGNTVNEDLQELDTRTSTAFTGATSSTAGVMGMVPAPASGQTTKFLKSNGTWATPDDSEIASAAVSGQTNLLRK